MTQNICYHRDIDAATHAGEYNGPHSIHRSVKAFRYSPPPCLNFKFFSTDVLATMSMTILAPTYWQVATRIVGTVDRVD
uniref:Uncharacterized protein n=1 Tax=Arundo donax TaxID=35708 RepID=A0A0A9D307_ARUDO